MRKFNGTKKIRKTQAVLLSAAVLAGTFACNTSALGAALGQAQLSPQFHILVDGAEQTFYSASGKEVHPLVYEGATYLPLRAIGELMGKNVNWDQTTQTVSLSGVRSAPSAIGTPEANAKSQRVSIQVCPEFTVMVDGVTRNFTDANGSAVYPLLYQGSTYLPLRAIGELMGKSVSWDNSTKTASLTSSSGLQVTDADSFTQAPAQQPSASGLVSAETAKANALAHAGIAAEQAAFTKQKLEWDSGRQIYDITFFAGNAEYDYEIDALTGAVLEFDYDSNRSAALPGVPAGTLIGEAKAREIALSKVPGAAAANVVKLKLDRDDHETKYEVEIFYGNTEYDFEIDAYSGAILEWDSESHR